MKTKFFLLLAALLLSVSAFAQSESPLKGDVNNDGTVDVADINAIIEIMKNGGGTGEETKYYFSIGTNAVTASNYTTVNNATTTIPTTQTFWNNSGSKSLIYVLVPSNKTVTCVDASLNLPIGMVDAGVTITNHKVYVTDGKIANGGGIKVTISDAAPVSNYYYYAGWTLPTVDNVETIINETYPAEYGSSVMNTAGKKTTSASSMDYTTNNLYNANAKATYYVLVPTGQAIYDSLGNNVIASTFTSQGTINVGNQTHTIYASNSTSRGVNAIIIR